ncbi:MAG: ferritin [Christensenellales bacterium]|jgi:ferritin
MLNEKIFKMLNEQINKELYSAYLYLAMADYYNEEGLEGFENWFVVQAKEEMSHAMLIRTYLLNNGAHIELLPIDAPAVSYEDYATPLNEALEHEKFVTASINEIYEAAQDAKDHPTVGFLNWFIEEQAEEEKSAEDLIIKYELFGEDSQGLYLLDKEFGERTYSPPSLEL